MRGAPLLCAILALTAQAPQRLCAQAPWSTLDGAAREVAAKWSTHDFAGVVPPGRVEIRLPGTSGSGPVPAEQAVVMLAGYVRGAVESSVTVTSAMEVSPTSGFAELRRRYRPEPVGGEVEETILIGFERSRGAAGGREGTAEFSEWRVTVIQMVGAGGR